MRKLLKSARRWEVRTAGKGSKGERWYAWAWAGPRSPGHSLLVRRHLKTGELAFHYCYVPEGQFHAIARHTVLACAALAVCAVTAALLAAESVPSWPPGHVAHWDWWTRRHQARARWFHKRTRLGRDAEISLVS